MKDEVDGVTGLGGGATGEGPAFAGATADRRGPRAGFILCITNMQWFSHVGGGNANAPLVLLALLVISLFR